ncbi:MAG: anti-sigma factor family protein [Armatimonadota bacterium]
MKTCREWEHAIVEYVDGVCPPDTAQKLEAHLASCKACAEAVREHLRLKRAVAQLEREHAPAHLARRIRDHARASLRRRSLARLLMRASFAATAATAVVFVLWWNLLRPEMATVPPAEEPTVAQAIVQEYVGVTSHDGFSDPSLQMLAREAQMKTLRLEPVSQ